MINVCLNDVMTRGGTYSVKIAMHKERIAGEMSWGGDIGELLNDLNKSCEFCAVDGSLLLMILILCIFFCGSSSID